MWRLIYSLSLRPCLKTDRTTRLLVIKQPGTNCASTDIDRHTHTTRTCARRAVSQDKVSQKLKDFTESFTGTDWQALPADIFSGWLPPRLFDWASKETSVVDCLRSVFRTGGKSYRLYYSLDGWNARSGRGMRIVCMMLQPGRWANNVCYVGRIVNKAAGRQPEEEEVVIRDIDLESIVSLGQQLWTKSAGCSPSVSGSLTKAARPQHLIDSICGSSKVVLCCPCCRRCWHCQLSISATFLQCSFARDIASQPVRCVLNSYFRL